MEDESETGRAIRERRNENGDVLFTGRNHPRIFGVDLIILFELSTFDGTEQKFMGKIALALFVGIFPLFKKHILEPSHGLFFGDTSIGHAIQMLFVEILLILS